MIVVDNTVLIDFWVGEDVYRDKAKELFMQDSEWLAPGIWLYEFGNVFRKYQRQNIISEDMKQMAWIKTLRMVKTVEEVKVLEIDKIAGEAGLSFYDASYVWLARSKSLDFYTRDKQILGSCSDVARAMPEQS